MDGNEAKRHDEERVRRAIEQAGARPPLRHDDLDAIEAAARRAWRAKVAEVRTAESAQIAGRTGGRRLALAAALLVAALGLGIWWAQRDGGAAATVAARVAAVDGALWIVGEAGETQLAAGAELPAGAELRSGGDGEPAGRAALRLAGGTALRLDAGSRLRLAAAARVELASGAVYVDTQGGAGGAVAVATPLATVRDVGTRFAVRLAGRDAAATVEVAVREGAVSVENGELLSLAAGEAVTVSAGGGVERRAEPVHGPAWDWVLAAAPPYAVEGRTLEEFLAWVAAETGWRVVYADPALARRGGEITLHGDVAGLRPDQAPFAVLPAADLAAEEREGVLTVRRR